MITIQNNQRVQVDRSTGFTLIEVMITVAIIGILAAIAIPLYSNYVLKGKVPIATSGLAGEQTQMEQFFQDNNTYLGATACSSAGTTTTSKYFTFDCSVAASATGYTLRATGVNSMAGFTYTLAFDGTRVSTTPSWGNSASCWVIAPGGTC